MDNKTIKELAVELTYFTRLLKVFQCNNHEEHKI